MKEMRSGGAPFKKRNGILRKGKEWAEDESGQGRTEILFWRSGRIF